MNQVQHKAQKHDILSNRIFAETGKFRLSVKPRPVRAEPHEELYRSLTDIQLFESVFITPTNLQIPKDSKVDDYGKKVRA